MGNSSSTHQAFGLRLQSHLPLPELPIVAGDGRVDVQIRSASRETVDAAFTGPAEPGAARAVRLGDGSTYRTERGRGDDIRIEYGRRALFHLAAGGGQLRCWAANPDELSWRRFLLDTVLGTVMLEHGFEALHAGAFERDGEVVAVVAGEGGGKSTLLAELVHRGRPLFCDDLLTLARCGSTPVAHPGPPLMNLTPKLPDGTPAGRVGRVLGVVDGESWVAIERSSTRPRALGAIVFLTRRGHRPVEVHRVPPNPAPLLSRSLLSGREPARIAARFSLFADVAATVPLLRLRIPVDLPAPQAADALERALNAPRARETAA
jgi:hypothetical protein